jgi:hypothetical protein
VVIVSTPVMSEDRLLRWRDVVATRPTKFPGRRKPNLCPTFAPPICVSPIVAPIAGECRGYGMASFKTRKRKDGTPIITVQVRMRGYPSRTTSFPTERLAKRWAKVTEAAMIEGRHFKNVASRRRTFAQAADRYLADEIPKKRGGSGMHKAALRYWREAIGHLDGTPRM